MAGKSEAIESNSRPVRVNPIPAAKEYGSGRRSVNVPMNGCKSDAVLYCRGHAPFLPPWAKQNEPSMPAFDFHGHGPASTLSDYDVWLKLVECQLACCG